MAIKIYVDQGHNPVNPNAGAEGNGLREQDIVYAIGQELYALLESDPDFEARLSRPTPETQLGNSGSSSLRARVNDANAWGANYFISLHTNASVNPAFGGIEGFAYSTQSEGFVFGEYLLLGVAEYTGLDNRGMFTRPGLYVLRKTAMPSVLLELGFISNPAEAALLSARPDLFARGIYAGMLRYFGLE